MPGELDGLFRSPEIEAPSEKYSWAPSRFCRRYFTVDIIPQNYWNSKKVVTLLVSQYSTHSLKKLTVSGLLENQFRPSFRDSVVLPEDRLGANHSNKVWGFSLGLGELRGVGVSSASSSPPACTEPWTVFNRPKPTLYSV